MVSQHVCTTDLQASCFRQCSPLQLLGANGCPPNALKPEPKIAKDPGLVVSTCRYPAGLRPRREAKRLVKWTYGRVTRQNDLDGRSPAQMAASGERRLSRSPDATIHGKPILTETRSSIFRRAGCLGRCSHPGIDTSGRGAHSLAEQRAPLKCRTSAPCAGLLAGGQRFGDVPIPAAECVKPIRKINPHGGDI